MVDIVAMGELLIDFTPESQVDNGKPLFAPNPGGAPANVLAASAKLGQKTAFIGKVGEDAFGRYLQKQMHAQGINTRGLIFAKDANTTLAFVVLSESGERSFMFYRKPGADMLMHASEIDYDMIHQAKIFHFGSVSLTHEPSRSATYEAVSFAKKSGLLISYDPNVRMNLWNNAVEAKEQILHMMPYAHLLKISEEELEFLTGTNDAEAGTEQLVSLYGHACILVTLGHKGCFYRIGEMTGHVPGFSVTTVDTNGAGDAFLGGVLYQIVQVDRPLSELESEDIQNMVRFANAVGALVTTKKGAMPAMPTLSEVYKLLDLALSL